MRHTATDSSFSSAIPAIARSSVLRSSGRITSPRWSSRSATSKRHRRGALIAQGMTLPLHLGSIPDAMGCIMRKFGTSVRPGDVFILNDPYEGGTHLPDFYIVKPVWFEDALIGWAATIGHQLDVGGMTPGGNGCDATEIFQEGLRIPPL